MVQVLLATWNCLGDLLLEAAALEAGATTQEKFNVLPHIVKI
jgi:hypothetical protein